jgi:hypothetical protein
MGWSQVRRVAFRFGFIFAALLVFPFPLGVIPKTDGLAELLGKPLEWLVRWFAAAVLDLEEPSARRTGSGDTTYAYVMQLVIAIVASLGAAVWTALDRRRTAYPRLAAAALVVLRYYLAATLLAYAIAKLFQFPPPGPTRLDQRVGDMSPMGLLWTFMGSSRPYALFAGFAEALGGALLLWRRTHVAGALVAMAAMANVVALNFCYDVPVKLFSTQLLVIGAVIFAPHARRVIGALLGRAAPELPPPPPRTRRVEHARLVAKALLLGGLAVELGLEIAEGIWRMPPKHELHGIWVVDEHATGGVERPPLLTDPERWHKVHFSQLGVAVRPMDGPIVRLPATVDAARHTIEIKPKDRTDPAETWRYTLSREGALPSLVLDGTLRGKPFHAELHREPDPLLVTRGFHWINEVPFNH